MVLIAGSKKFVDNPVASADVLHTALQKISKMDTWQEAQLGFVA